MCSVVLGPHLPTSAQLRVVFHLIKGHLYIELANYGIVEQCAVPCSPSQPAPSLVRIIAQLISPSHLPLPSLPYLCLSSAITLMCMLITHLQAWPPGDPFPK